MRKPEIIGSTRSTYTRVVRMVCEEKGIDHTLTDVPLGAPDELISPSSRAERSEIEGPLLRC